MLRFRGFVSLVLVDIVKLFLYIYQSSLRTAEEVVQRLLSAARKKAESSLEKENHFQEFPNPILEGKFFFYSCL